MIQLFSAATFKPNICCSKQLNRTFLLSNVTQPLFFFVSISQDCRVICVVLVDRGDMRKGRT